MDTSMENPMTTTPAPNPPKPLYTCSTCGQIWDDISSDHHCPPELLENAAFPELVYKLWSASHAAGWWDEGVNLPTVLTKLLLIHSEVSEAMEALRRGGLTNPQPDSHLPQYPAFAVELVDAVIRLLDLAGAVVVEGWRLNFLEILLAKHQYNQKRADHNRETRRQLGGKLF
jgi:hypothetical protein